MIKMKNLLNAIMYGMGSGLGELKGGDLILLRIGYKIYQYLLSSGVIKEEKDVFATVYSIIKYFESTGFAKNIKVKRENNKMKVSLNKILTIDAIDKLHKEKCPFFSCPCFIVVRALLRKNGFDIVLTKMNYSKKTGNLDVTFNLKRV
jgi:hypothetical protein